MFTPAERARYARHLILPDIGEALRAAGFGVAMRRSYGSYRLLPGDVAVVAERR